jgi:hypothetical protein
MMLLTFGRCLQHEVRWRMDEQEEPATQYGITSPIWIEMLSILAQTKRLDSSSSMGLSAAVDSNIQKFESKEKKCWP